MSGKITTAGPREYRALSIALQREVATLQADVAAAYRRGLEDAAKLAETWGNAPPNPRGRRAALAAEIRALASEKP